jgi:hypothetical protein
LVRTPAPDAGPYYSVNVISAEALGTLRDREVGGERLKGSLRVGKLLYGSSKLEIEFEDRILAHLQIVIGVKLRRGEGFFFSWRDDPALGDGRSSIWIESSIPLFFKFSTTERHQLNREWLEDLTHSSNQAQGLTLIAEPTGELVTPKSNV